MTLESTNMLRGARILVDTCAAVRPGDKCVVITDHGRLAIAEAVLAVLFERGLDPVLCMMGPRATHGQEPPESIAAAAREADVVFAPTTFSLAHSDARFKACQAGARWVNMPDYHNCMMVSGGLYADFDACNILAQKLADVLTEGTTVSVETPSGSRFTSSIRGRVGRNQSGLVREPGSFGSPPDIESHVAPVEDSTEGVFVADASIPLPEIGVLTEPVSIQIHRGRINAIEGGAAARILSDILTRFRNPAVYVAAEIGIGLNPEARFIGAMLEDEGVGGSIHVGFGDNHGIGGQNLAPAHIDLVARKPTVTVDGRRIIIDGELQI
ncbi:MAG: leucyl aminopeptidase [Firmicutes bacterium]|nr:leucyl aminopeptidase [Bacillota bacterium]